MNYTFLKRVKKNLEAYKIVRFDCVSKGNGMNKYETSSSFLTRKYSGVYDKYLADLSSSRSGSA